MNNTAPAAQFDRLVTQYQDMACGYAYSLTGGNYALAQDIAQEAFLIAWRKWDTLRTPDAFGAWLRTIIFSQCMGYGRKQKPADGSVPLYELANHAAPRHHEPQETVQKNNDRAAVRKAIYSLPQGERDAVILFYLFGNSRDETAHFLSISPDAVKKRLQRARTRLLKELLTMLHDDLEMSRPSNNEQFVRELQTQRDEHDALANRVHTTLANDNRVVAAWLFTNTQSGDLAHMGGTKNPWHPLHVQAVVKAETIEEFIAGRRAYAHRVGEPLLFVEAPQNAPENGAYLMAIYDGEAGPYEVDWYFASLSASTKIPPEQKRREETRNRTSVFWAIWLVSARYIVRQRNNDPLFLGEMLRGLLRETRQFVGDPSGENVPLPTRALHKVQTLRQMARDMGPLMPRIVAAGGEIPGDAIVSRAARYLRRVEETVSDGFTAGS